MGGFSFMLRSPFSATAPKFYTYNTSWGTWQEGSTTTRRFQFWRTLSLFNRSEMMEAKDGGYGQSEQRPNTRPNGASTKSEKGDRCDFLHGSNNNTLAKKDWLP